MHTKRWSIIRTAVSILAVLALASCGGHGTRFTGDAEDDADAAADAQPDSPDDSPGDTPGDPTGDDPDWTIPGCGAQDAWTSGDCAMELPGIVWNGERCTYFGSGCDCEGEDCDDLYDTFEDCVAAHRECYGETCAPMPVAGDSCMMCEPARQGVAWNGVECVELYSCGCVGEGCDRMFLWAGECEAVQASCDSALCVTTGGSWLGSMPCGPCGNYECGLPPALGCCGAGCDCGPYRSFVPGEGCAVDPSCTKDQACVATGGTWYPADPCGPCGDLHCGEPNMLPCCDAGCDCGPGRSFLEGEGCAADPTCSPTREDLCVGTGGTWHPADPCGPCGDYWCGIPSMDDCCDAGCDCGQYRVYDPEDGCVWSAECLNRGEGESCSGWAASSTCTPGLVCCATCGIPTGCMQCQQPCCPDLGTAYCGTDGCPPPPP